MKTIYLILNVSLLITSHIQLLAISDPDGKSADMSRPVQVFIIMGQSNTLEMGKVKGHKEGALE